MIGVVGKTTNRDIFGALPFDPASGASLGQLLHPSQHLLFGCFNSPMQSLTASYNSPLDDLRVGGSKEDGSPNHTICAVDHCVPPGGKALTALRAATTISVRRCMTEHATPNTTPSTRQPRTARARWTNFSDRSGFQSSI